MILSQGSTDSTQVILVRHARTNYNEQGRYQVNTDESILTEKGYQDAFATGLALQQYHFDAIYTSPLKRVQQTTQSIVSALNQIPPVYIEPRLSEICMSHWQGLFYQEVKEKYAKEYQCWQEKPHLFNFENQVFPVLDLFKQTQAFWQDILNKHQGETILIVAHGGTNRALISTAIGLQPQYFHHLQQSNCGISSLEFISDSSLASLKTLNVTFHLGETLPKLKAGKTGYRWLLLSDAIAQTPSQISDLKTIIDHQSIDLLLTKHSASQSYINPFLGEQKPLYLSLPKLDSLQNWQQKILELSKLEDCFKTKSLVTGIIIASDSFLSQIIQDTLTFMAPLDLDLVHHFAVIHTPQINNNSILQGILPLNADVAALFN